jgi:hypothetical protein
VRLHHFRLLFQQSREEINGTLLLLIYKKVESLKIAGREMVGSFMNTLLSSFGQPPPGSSRYRQ